jgi:hypothetical protein
LCYSPEPDNLFSLQPRVLAVHLSQELTTEERKQTGNLQAFFLVAENVLNRFKCACKEMFYRPIPLGKSLGDHVYSRLMSHMENNLLRVPLRHILNQSLYSVDGGRALYEKLRNQRRDNQMTNLAEYCKEGRLSLRKGCFVQDDDGGGVHAVCVFIPSVIAREHQETTVSTNCSTERPSSSAY